MIGWAADNGFIRPFKYSVKDGACVIFQFYKNDCRIKFEIGFSYDNNDASVCFHNNDYDYESNTKKQIAIKDFKVLYDMFVNCFPDVDKESEVEGFVFNGCNSEFTVMLPYIVNRINIVTDSSGSTVHVSEGEFTSDKNNITNNYI